MIKLTILMMMFFIIQQATAEMTVAPPGEYQGMIEIRDWSKTPESYCHAGSKYLVLVDGENTHILFSERDPEMMDNVYRENVNAMRNELASLSGLQVTLEAVPVTQSLSESEHCPDPKMQCVMGTITCSWLRVMDVLYIEIPDAKATMQ